MYLPRYPGGLAGGFLEKCRRLVLGRYTIYFKVPPPPLEIAALICITRLPIMLYPMPQYLLYMGPSFASFLLTLLPTTGNLSPSEV